MGKSKRKQPQHQGERIDQNHEQHPHANDVDNDSDPSCHSNPLYKKQRRFLQSLSPTERRRYFSPSAITPDRRAQIWMDQATIGERLVNRYSWATPTVECIKIFKYFQPIIEMGSGSNAYWANYLHKVGSVDIVAFDMNIDNGGKIQHHHHHHDSKAKNGNEKKRDSNDIVQVQQGGPEVLKRPEFQNRTLFLCYPDEEDDIQQIQDNSINNAESSSESDSDDNNTVAKDINNRKAPTIPPLSFAWHCLEQHQGQYVIHVGEIAFYDTNLNVDVAPWGRSSSIEFQQRLASEYHCILKIELPNWLNVRDSLSVWKRSQICTMVFEGENDEEKEEEEEEEIVEYRYIPPEEMLPKNIAAPCMAHLLPSVSNRSQEKTAIVTSNAKGSNYFVNEESFGARKRKHSSVENSLVNDDLSMEEEQDSPSRISESQSSIKKKNKKKKKKRQKTNSSDQGGGRFFDKFFSRR